MCSTNSIVYAPFILKNFEHLRDSDISLKPFFDSNLAFYKVVDKHYFPDHSKENSVLILPANCESIIDIYFNYENIYGIKAAKSGS